MNILIAAATPFEIGPLLDYLTKNSNQSEDGTFNIQKLKITPFIHGVGSVLTATHLSHALGKSEFHLVLQAGIGGAYDNSFKLGDVVQVTQDGFLDVGVEEKNGDFTSIFEMGLIEPNQYPFQETWIKSESETSPTFLRKVNGGTVNKVHGSKESIDKTVAKYPEIEVESMEGAAAAYACKIFEVPFIQIRGISNYVEPRNRDNWELELAINKLNEVLIGMVETLAGIEEGANKS